MPNLDEALALAQSALRAQNHAPPGETADAARKRAAEQIKAQQRLIDTSVAVTKRLTGIDARGGNGADPAALKEQGKQPVLWKHVESIMDLIATPINANFKHLADQIAALKARIAELEARPTLEDAGTWNATKVFKPGNVVTHEGSAWVCREANSNARPGQHDAWRLMVKHGKDARGSR